MLDRPNSLISDHPETALPYHAIADGNPLAPTIDSILFDDLEAEQNVMIDDVTHKFVMKLPDDGPHLFLNTKRGETVRHSTTKLFELLDQRRYYNPGRTRISFEQVKSIDEARILIAKAYNTINEGPRNLGETKYRYIAEFINRMLIAPRGRPFDRNHNNAELVIDEVNAQIFRENQALPANKKIFQPKTSSRSVLRWVADELKLQLQERACVHLNAVKARKRKLPKEIFSIIALEIRKMLDISPRFGATKILIRVNAEITKRNAPIIADNIAIERLNKENEERIANGEAVRQDTGKTLPFAKLTTVQTEFRRYDAWIKIAKAEGKQAADLEFGGSGKFERPMRILDLVEIDHHKFDFMGILGETPFGRAWSTAAIDRFWICLVLDCHSGYPVGLFPSFEPGGLHPALMALDHAIKPKLYVKERFPQIRGSLLSFGKPRKVKYDNGKEFVSEQMTRALTRVGISFELAIPHRPDTKPYVERFFGTMEQDFINWLKGSTGSSPTHRGARRPKLDAIITIDDFIMLLHMWLIEVYARRKQAGMDYDTPEGRWLEGASSSSHRPQPLTKEEAQRWDLIPCLELDLMADRHGIRWNNLFFQSEQLQKMRRRSGCYGPKVDVPTPVRCRIPLFDVGRCIVADPTCLDPGNEELPKEFDVKSTDERARGLNKFQWETFCKFRLAKKNAPTSHLPYEDGFNHLFETAIEAMGMVPTDQTPPKTAVFSNGRNPRLAGVLAHGAERPALAGTEELIEKIGMVKRALDRPDAPPTPPPLGAVVPETEKSPPQRKKLKFSVDAPLPDDTHG
jgi:putative transposase